jgi:hypothetical protein
MPRDIGIDSEGEEYLIWDEWPGDIEEEEREMEVERKDRWPDPDPEGV